MGSHKFTKDRIRHFSMHMAEKAHGKEVRAKLAAEIEAGRRLVDINLGPKVLEAVRIVPSDLLSSTYSVFVTRGGDRSENVRVQHGDLRNSNPDLAECYPARRSFDASGPKYKAAWALYDEAVKKREAAASRKNEVREKVAAMMEGASTSRRFFEMWPEVEAEYIKVYGDLSKPAPLPVAKQEITELNKRLGLPEAA